MPPATALPPTAATLLASLLVFSLSPWFAWLFAQGVEFWGIEGDDALPAAFEFGIEFEEEEARDAGVGVVAADVGGVAREKLVVELAAGDGLMLAFVFGNEFGGRKACGGRPVLVFRSEPRWVPFVVGYVSRFF